MAHNSFRVSRTNRNKFGTQWTIHIHINSAFFISIHWTNKHSLLVEFYEKKLINKKLHFTYISEDGLINTAARSIDDAYDALCDLGKEPNDYNQWERSKRGALIHVEMANSSHLH